MHDPSTVAHEIKYPWKNSHGYRDNFITVWHEDPMNWDGKVRGRDDDSCGWFNPPYSESDRETIAKICTYQYSTLFPRQVALKEGASYASVCYDQDVYGAVYWSWRCIKHIGKKGWMYGNYLSNKELESIYHLVSNPVDNIQHIYKEVRDEESFRRLFFIVWNAYRRLHRPWYKHPRWHVHHWSFQMHPLQSLKRRFWDKCCKCGKRGFKKGDSAIGNWSGKEIWHSSCDNIEVYQNV